MSVVDLHSCGVSPPFPSLHRLLCDGIRWALIVERQLAAAGVTCSVPVATVQYSTVPVLVISRTGPMRTATARIAPVLTVMLQYKQRPLVLPRVLMTNPSFQSHRVTQRSCTTRSTYRQYIRYIRHRGVGSVVCYCIVQTFHSDGVQATAGRAEPETYVAPF